MTQEAKPQPELAQTLDRGLQVLEFLGASVNGFTATEVAQHVGIHRSIAARLLATLAHRKFATRMSDGRYVIGTGLFSLARMVSRDLISIATPMLRDATERVVATSVLHVADGDEVVTVLSIEPPSANFRVGMRVGARGPLDLAAHGVAILAGRPAQPGERALVSQARERGYATTTGEVVPGYTGLSAPVYIGGEATASVGLVIPAARGDEVPELAAEVLKLAEALSLASG
ncbi:IclR family transcriptional regulator [Amycolatopsis jejuensis]|uniref:IclR family transcriptional regulator n=1 Tax=Amycolatopsis jejuensis TaxID=330084 RepID=UPI000526ADE0|nr:helix-turn-helix domain-containing protein [Amycolatopsis jejuensis]